MTRQPQTVSAWDGILAEDEHIIWQGQPVPLVKLPLRKLPFMAFGVLFAGFAVFWMVTALPAGGFLWMAALPHFCVGITIAIWPIWGQAFIHRRTWYTLTNRRAFIAENLPWKRNSLASYPITEDTPFEFDGEAKGSIWFGQRYPSSLTRKGPSRAGFENLEDAQTVYRYFLDVQRAQRA